MNQGEEASVTSKNRRNEGSATLTMLDEVPPAPPCPAAPPLPTEKAKVCDLPTHATSWIKSQSKVEDRRHVVDRIKRLVQYEFPRRYPALLSGVTTNDPFPGWNCKISIFHTYPVVQEGPRYVLKKAYDTTGQAYQVVEEKRKLK